MPIRGAADRREGHPLFAALYDRLNAPAERGEIGRRRAALLAGLSGSVLEVGGGTGANLPYYPRGLQRLVVTEPDPHMRRRLSARAATLGVPVEVVDAPAESLPFDDAVFDAVVSTVVLCSVAQPERALAEVARVMRRGGTLHFAEHIRSGDPRLARWQDRLTPLQRRIAGGCNLNRPTLELISAARFTVEHLEPLDLPSPFARLLPSVSGVARRNRG